MTLVVSLTTILTDEVHSIVLLNVLRVVLHKALHAVPESGDSLDVLEQTDDEAVLLVVLLHESERVTGNVAEELDAGLHAPVVLVVQHQLVAEKESRFVAAHVTVALRISIDDLLATHLLARLFRFVLVNPFWVRPVVLRDAAVVSGTGHQRSGQLLELVVKVLVVQENPIIVVVAVEAVLDGADRLGDIPDVAVAGEGDKGGVYAFIGFHPSYNILGLLLLDFLVGRTRRGKRGAGWNFKRGPGDEEEQCDSLDETLAYLTTKLKALPSAIESWQ